MSISDYTTQDQVELQKSVAEMVTVLKKHRDQLPVGDYFIQEALDIPYRWTGSEIYIYAHVSILVMAELLQECELKLEEYDDADTVEMLVSVESAALTVLTNLVGALNKARAVRETSND